MKSFRLLIELSTQDNYNNLKIYSKKVFFVMPKSLRPKIVETFREVKIIDEEKNTKCPPNQYHNYH